MASETEPLPKSQIILGRVLLGLAGFPLVSSGLMKVIQPADFLANWSKTMPAGSARPLGIIEVVFYVLVCLPKTRFLGLAILTAYMGGAVCVHVQMGDWKAIFPTLVGVFLWLGTWLLDRRFRALAPIGS